MTRKAIPFFLLSLALLLPVAFAQTKPLTNDDVIKMVKADLGDEITIKAITANETAFDTSPDTLLQLKSAGVTKHVLDAMIEAQAKKNSVQPAAASAPSHKSTPAPPEFAKTAEKTSLSALIYVEEVSSSGGVMASSDTTIEAMKTLQEHGMRVTTNKEKADYILQVTRQLGKKRWSKDTKIALSNKDGEVILAKSTRSIGGAMGEVVDFVRKHSE